MLATIPKDDFSAAPIAQEDPHGGTFQLSPLYRLGAYDKGHIWIIGFDGECLTMQWGTVEDMENSSLQCTRTAVEINTSGRNLYEQALLEARARWKRKQDKDGYSEKFIDMNVLNMPAMLANKWDPTKNQIKRWPVWVQEKLDGVRCRANRDLENNAFLISRTKLTFSHFEHIRRNLVNLFPHIIAVLKHYILDIESVFRLDGELYTSDLTFDRISGISRLTNKSGPDLEEYLIKYYIFDISLPGNLTYDERWQILYTAFQNYEKENPTSNLRLLIPMVARSKEDILKAHRIYVRRGYEGVIIRKIGGQTERERSESYYVGRRSSNILKYKAFQDEEGQVIGAEQGKGTEEGAVVWNVQNPQGIRFNVRPKGTIDTRKQYYQAWLQNPNQFIGLKYRYRFQEFTPDGKPRFPVGIGFVFDHES